MPEENEEKVYSLRSSIWMKKNEKYSYDISPGNDNKIEGMLLSEMIEKIKEIISYSLIGVAAYMATDIVHEVFGHAGTCLIIGQKIKLLTSVYFRSQPGSIITNIGRLTLANLSFGLLIFYFLKMKRNFPILLRLLLFLTMLYSFYWFSGTIIESSFSGSGDWTYLIKQLDLRGLGKIILIITGMAALLFFYQAELQAI